MPGDDLEGRPGGKFLKWALSWGKRIVIVTEAIVILAFLSRFWLDTTAADLAEKITVKKNVITASANFEQKFRSLSKRVSEASVIEKQVSPIEVLDKVNAMVPKNATITQLSLSATGVNMSGTSDEQSLALLVTAFRNSPDFTDLYVDKITKTSPSQLIDFAMRATYIKGETNEKKL